jgi:hypothetical protein
MAEEPQAIRGINWRDTFPFTNLFRTFRIAIHPSKLGLALLLLLTFYVGGRVLDGVWPNQYKPMATATPEIYERPAPVEVGAAELMAPRQGIFSWFLQYESSQINRIAMGVLGLSPAAVAAGVVNFIILGPATVIINNPVFAILLAVLFLFVWSIFGGAIARIAAVHVARDEKISVRQAIRFSIGKFLSFLFAPLIPLVIVLIVGLVVAIGGLLLYVPWVGPILVGLLFGLALLAGFIMTLVLVGTVGGFNLMYPTIAVEGSDSFDAISRSFSYVYARPWRMIFYTLVALVYGALAYLFIRLFVYVLLAVTHWFVGLFLWGQSGTYWRGEGRAAAMWPPPDFYNLTYAIDFGGLKWSEAIAAALIAFWVYLVIAALGAFIISFYFSANTIIYYLMRREVDATELDDVYIEEADEEFLEPAPVTAAPAEAGISPAAATGAAATTSGPADKTGPEIIEPAPEDRPPAARPAEGEVSDQYKAPPPEDEPRP